MNPDNRNIRNEEMEIDLLELFFYLLQRFWIIFVCMVLCAGMALGYTKLAMTPMYSSSSTIYIVGAGNDMTSLLSDLQAGSQLTSDYKYLATSQPVVEKVINDLELDMESDTLAQRISTENPSDSHMLKLTVRDEDPHMAKVIVDDLTEVMIKQVAAVMENSEPNIVHMGKEDDKPVSPSTKKNTLMGAALGLVLCVMFFTVMFIMDDRIKDPADVERYLGLNVLGSIPIDEESGEEKTKRSRFDGIKFRMRKKR